MGSMNCDEWQQTRVRFMEARAAGHSAETVLGAAHVSAGACQIADRRTDAVEALTKAMPGWLKQGLERVKTQVPQPGADDIVAPENYLVCEIIRREAVALVGEPGK